MTYPSSAATLLGEVAGETGAIDITAIAAFAAVLGATSVVALTARWFHRVDVLPTPSDWALGGRRFGTVTTWFLLGSTIYTAYTFVAVPGLVYATGALGFFALPYTVIVYPLAFWLLPRLWREARDLGAVTIADVVRIRHDSATLALTVALTGILATMPYVALQLLGIRTVLTALGVYPAGLVGDGILTSAFAVLAVATYRNGLRAPAVISFLKGALVFGAITLVTTLVIHEIGGTADLFSRAEQRLARPITGAEPGGHDGAAPATFVQLDPSLATAYASLMVGSALALLMYPHVLTAAFAARGAGVLRRNAVALLGWTALLGMFALLGFAAHAVDVQIDVSPGRAELAMPLLIERLTPSWATGLLFGSLAVGALVPAAVMSVAAAMLFTRNIYAEYVNPLATPKQQTRIAQVVSLFIKIGALVFVLLLADQNAINLQLLGGVWILQTFPAIIFCLVRRRPPPAGLLVGWATGMLAGTFMVTTGGFSAVVTVAGMTVYAAVAALVINLIMVGLISTFASRIPRFRSL